MNLIIHSMPFWLELVSLVFCIGGLACLLWVLPARESEEVHHRGLNHLQLWFFLRLSVFSAMVGSCIDLLIRTAEMSGEPISSAFPYLPTVLFKTHIGQVWLIRMITYIIISLMMTVANKYRDNRKYLLPLFCLGVLAAMMESASGHAADKGDFSIAEIMDWLHLFAASVWGGGLFALALTLHPATLETDGHANRSIVETASRFSRIAGFAVVTIAVTAVYQAWVYVGSYEAVVKSSYGWTLVVKSFLFLSLILFGAINRYIGVPGIREWSGLPQGKQGIVSRLVKPVLTPFTRNREERTSIHRFAFRIRIEAFLVAAVLLFASLLRHEVPAKHYLHQHNNRHEHHHIQ
jgi:copper resistance protein D